MRVFLMPLGFHEDVLLRAMMRLRVHRGDLVYVVTCGPVLGAVKRAFESLKAMCLKQEFPEPALVELDCRDFYGSIRRVRELVSGYTGADIYLCSGAGLRILAHVLEIALLSTRKPFHLYYEPEAEGVEPVFVPSTLYLNIYRKPSGLEERVLGLVLQRRDVSVKEITRELGAKEKTVRNILTRLKNLGLISRKAKGRFEPTPIAIALYG